MSRLLVLDFDGTMTDAELEGAPFRSAYLDDIAILADLPREEAEALATRFEAEVAANADSEGWLFGGHIVAPATVDPYLRVMPVARRILDHAGAFTVPAERDRLLDGILYKHNYRHTAIAFRGGAGEVLRSLEGTATYVVTNSHTEAVQRKIQALGGDAGDLDWLVERVYGRARKYALDADFGAVPASMQLPGLERPVLLRRRLYHDVLDALRIDAKADWADVVVIGDIFELDLALPLAMGARVGLLANEFTPTWEKDFLAEHTHGAVLHDVSEIPAFAGLG
jgi:FMN phosphatase YigB (HAD superfamily)